MSNTEKGTSYEQFVRDVQTAILSAQNVSTASVVHNKNLRGAHSGTEHQIDVYWEYRLGGVTHKVAIECKNWNKSIDIGVIRALKGTLDDVPGLRGIVVSPVGFQQGAIDFARAHGIGLKLIRKPQSSQGDYTGNGWTSARSIQLNIVAVTKNIIDTKVHVDRDWLELPENTLLRSRVLGRRIQTSSDNVIIEIEDHAPTIRRISMTQLVDEIPAQPVHGIPYCHEFRWTNAWIFLDQTYRVKLKGVDIVYELRSSSPFVYSMHSDEAIAIVRDIIDETLLIVEQDGVINGDSEKEGIQKK